MNKTAYILIGLIAIAGVGYFVLGRDTSAQNKAAVSPIAKDMMFDEKNQMVTGDKAEVADQPTGQENKMAAKGSYVPYAPEKLAMAETGDVVLFFHASWCPSCRALNSDIEKNMSAIPAGVTILKTDYDQEVELKKKYGVTTQHTLVQVDKNGTQLKKWSGGASLESLISEIQ